MIVLRAVQGFTGGVLIPLAFTIMITVLPKSKQPIGLALFMLWATFAPAIGPTIGGYLTENYGWQYIFYVNLVPGIAMMLRCCGFRCRGADEARIAEERRLAGIAAMAIGLAALQTVLEEGNKDDWFGSPFIVRLSADRRRGAVALHVDRVDARQAAAQSATDRAAQFRLWPRREFLARRRAVWIGVPDSGAICREYRATTRSRSAKCSRGPGFRNSS